jgi:chromosomal replication initiator protein
MESRSAQEVWKAALGELQIQVSKSNYRTWLDKTIGINYQDNQFVIGVPNTFVAEYLDQNQRSLIEKILIGLTGQDIEVQFQVNGKHHGSANNATSTGGMPLATQGTVKFNPVYTFDTFVVGKGNRLACSAAQAVAENPGNSYNPLFIYGGPGLGKTHLLHAIGHASAGKNNKVLYVTAEQFTHDFVTALQQRKTEDFRSKYRNVDILLIDDIRFIGGKEQTEENFVHTFNDLHNANHQIVITSDRPPKSLPLTACQLRSRFEWGLVADIEPLDFEMRLAIIQAKASQKSVDIPADVLEFIARHDQQNVRELEGHLNRVTAYVRLTRAIPTIDLAREALRDIADGRRRAVISPALVIKAVAQSYQISPVDLTSRKRDKQSSQARQLAMYLIRSETSLSLEHIGREMGGRDHSTVLHACEKIAGEVVTNPDLSNRVTAIQQSLHRIASNT